MPIKVIERAKSRRFTVSNGTATGEVGYLAYRSDDYQLIYAAVIAEAPTTLEGLDFVGIDPSDEGGGVWSILAKYELPKTTAGADVGEPGDPLPDTTQGEEGGPNDTPGGGVDPETNGLPGDGEPLGPEWSFSTIGGTEKLLRSIETVAALPVGAPDYDRAINVTKDGVEGVELIQPKLELVCKKTHNFMTLSYIRLLSYMTGMVNNRKWGPFRLGEMLLMGAEGQQDQRGKWVVTYRFLNSRTMNNIAIDVAGDIIIPSKRGHDYLWTRLTEGQVGDALTLKVDAAYVEQVYPYENFNKLWI